MPEKPTKPAARRTRAAKPKPKATTPVPTHGEIAERAYFIHLQDGGRDEVGNWLRAEREMTAA